MRFEKTFGFDEENEAYYGGGNIKDKGGVSNFRGSWPTSRPPRVTLHDLRNRAREIPPGDRS
jgi:hypothetical protein